LCTLVVAVWSVLGSWASWMQDCLPPMIDFESLSHAATVSHRIWH
jgi:hypothetical protein